MLQTERVPDFMRGQLPQPRQRQLQKARIGRRAVGVSLDQTLRDEEILADTQRA